MMHISSEAAKMSMGLQITHIFLCIKGVFGPPEEKLEAPLLEQTVPVEQRSESESFSSSSHKMKSRSLKDEFWCFFSLNSVF